MNIRAENYLANQLANNVIIDNCIRKCVEELSQQSSKSYAGKTSSLQKVYINDVSQIQNEGNGNVILSCPNFTLGVKIGRAHV